MIKQVKVNTILVFMLLLVQAVAGQSLPKNVAAKDMQAVYEAVKTPYKYGLVMVPKNDSFKVDCPSIFRKGKKWFMSYFLFTGRGYETWLAESNDLLKWKTLGRILSFSDSTHWDASQKGGIVTLQDHRWGGSYELNKYDGKYWLSYFGGNAKGYEAGDLSIGIGYTTKDPSTPHEWKTLDKPVLTSKDADVRWWENRKIFHTNVIWDKSLTTGHPFVMFYNANGDTTGVPKTRWFERIGLAVSDDMVHWKRYIKEPVLQHEVGITGDALVEKIGDIWVMFYFGAFWKDKGGAFNRFACSYDLVNWTDWTGDDLIKSSEPYDEKYAHKSCVVKYNGVVYHFYNAVNNKEQRGIAVATSVDKGKSDVHFVK